MGRGEGRELRALAVQLISQPRQWERWEFGLTSFGWDAEFNLSRVGQMTFELGGDHTGWIGRVADVRVTAIVDKAVGACLAIK